MVQWTLEGQGRGTWLFLNFIFLQNLHTASAFQQLSKEIVTACAGRCFYSYSLTCPLGQKIAPRDLKYYAKAITDVCPADSLIACQDKQQCCHYYPGDCSVAFDMGEAFSVFRNCSALQQCGWFRAQSVSTRSHCSYRSKTNYVGVTYNCISDSTFIDICSNDTLRGSSINILYNGSRFSEYSVRAANCNCAVSTSDCESPARLRFRGVDVRLHQDHDLSKCHPHSRLTITDTVGSRNFRCQKNHFYRGYDDIYTSHSPYARVSLYNHPGLFPSQLWLSVEATMPGVDVVVTCGKLRPESQSFCGPPDILTTPNLGQDPPSTPADIFAKPDKSDENEQQDNKNTNQKPAVKPFIQSDLAVIIGGAAGGILLIIIIVVLIICLKRRRRRNRKPKMLPHPVPLSEPSSPVHSYPSYQSDPDDKYGNYYETMATDVPNGTAENSSPFTPGKSMGSFFPAEKKFTYPNVSSAPVPPPPVTLPVPTPSKDANPYHAPWDASMLQAPNRLKRNDLAYATSEEIQVLIQRMEHDRRNLNEGATASPAPLPSFSYIHIDDYKIKTPKTPSEKKEKEESPTSDPEGNEDLYVYENDSDTEEEEENEHHEEDDDADVESDDNNETENMQGATVGSQGTNEGTPRSNDNFCGSEDTGYRSVGSPEHVLVCEDDYLVPGSVKSAVSSNSKGTVSTVRMADRGSVTSSTYGEVYDALKDGQSMDVKTKF